MATTQELQRSLDELLDEAQAFAETSSEDLGEDQFKRFGDLTRQDDANPGMIQAAQRAVDRQKEIDDAKKRLALARVSQNRTLADASLVTEPHRQRIYAVPRMARLQAFKGENADQNAYNVGMWLRSIKARKADTPDAKADEVVKHLGWGFQAAQKEGDSSGGGYLVPEPLAATIIDNRETIGITRRLADVVPMSSETQDIPKVSSGLTVYAPGEGNAITASDAAYQQVKLVAIKRAVLNQISGELSDDALVNMTDRAAMEMARALALQEDSEFVKGDGTQTYFGEQGLTSKIGSAGILTQASGNTWGAITLADVVNTFGKLPSQYQETGADVAIICSAQFYWQVLMRLATAAGGNTLLGLQDGPMGPRFMGVPCVFTSQMAVATATATISALYGNFRRSVMLGDRTGVRIGISVDYAFNQDLISVRAITRYDINVHEPGDASNAGGYAALKTGS